MTEENLNNNTMENKTNSVVKNTKKRGYRKNYNKKTVAQEKVGAEKKTTRKRATKKEEFRFKKPNIKIIPLGGIEEIGKNITVFEYENDIIVVDCGLEFPTDDMLGIDLVIQDV